MQTQQLPQGRLSIQRQLAVQHKEKMLDNRLDLMKVTNNKDHTEISQSSESEGGKMAVPPSKENRKTKKILDTSRSEYEPSQNKRPKLSNVAKWFQMLEQLKEYRDKNGSCNVPQKYSENKPLGTWVNHQRKQYRLRQQEKKSQLTDERVAALESLGFQWNVAAPTTDWKTRFEELKQYKAKHGHCNVPAKFETQELGAWVHVQRTQYRLRRQGKKSKMTDERIAALEKLGFQWHAAAGWEARFAELTQYKAKHGHCNVPFQCTENKQLGVWVQYQRQQYQLFQRGKKQANITDDRVAALESIDFSWSVAETTTDWDTHFEELKEYKAKHGHCNVSKNGRGTAQLFRWVNHQRRQHRLRRQGKKSLMTEQRAASLDSLGFQWNLVEPRNPQGGPDSDTTADHAEARSAQLLAANKETSADNIFQLANGTKDVEKVSNLDEVDALPHLATDADLEILAEILQDGCDAATTGGRVEADVAPILAVNGKTDVGSGAIHVDRFNNFEDAKEGSHLATPMDVDILEVGIGLGLDASESMLLSVDEMKWILE